MCFVQGQRGVPFVVSFALALTKAQALALNAHVLRLSQAHVLPLNKADVLALIKAHLLRRNTKICPVFTANTKEAGFVGPPLWFSLCWLSPLGMS